MGPRLHAYSLDSRTEWLPKLVFAGLLLALAWGAIQERSGWKIPAYVDTPATLGFYGVLFAVVNKWGARWSFTRCLFDIPHFAGTYHVVAKSSYDQYKNEYLGTAEIRQTWTKICVHADFAASESWSEAAHAVEVAAKGGHQLVYEYRNQPKAEADRTLQSHTGTAWLRLSDDGRQLTGEYYTGRNRGTTGTLTFTRKT